MENKHQPYDLAQMQSLPLKYKIRMTQERIKAWYEYWDGQVYVSVSGGKDSQVLAHIVKQMYSDVPLVFVNTGLEYDSVRAKGIEMADEVLRPDKSFVQIITQYGYPIVSKNVARTIQDYRSTTISDKFREYTKRKLEGTAQNKDGKKSLYNFSKWKFLVDAPLEFLINVAFLPKKNLLKNTLEKQKENHL